MIYADDSDNGRGKKIIVLQSQSDFIVLSASEIEGPQLVERAKNVQVIKVQDKNPKIQKKNFVCTQCTASYTRNLSLQRHINGVHLKLKQYKCTFDNCDYSTAWSSGLNSHRDTKHHGVKRFRCSICDFKAYKNSNLNRHLNSVHLKGKYPCKFCSKTLTRLDRMKKHMKDCQSDFIIPTPEMEGAQVVDIAENVQVFKLQDQNEDNFESEVAQVVEITENDEVVKVQEKKVLKKNFVCFHCTASYTRNLDLQKHIDGVHLKFKQYKCTYEGCGYSTAWKSGLNSHRDTKHHNVKRFKCSICDFDAYKSGNLKRHLDSVHYRRKHQCKFCNKSCNKSVTRSDRMKKHMKECQQKYN